MKTTKGYTIDQDIINELKIRNIKNVSGLVNDLLKMYLQMNKQEIDIAEKDLENAQIEKKAELILIEQKQAQIKREKEDAEERLKQQLSKEDVLVIE